MIHGTLNADFVIEMSIKNSPSLCVKGWYILRREGLN